MKLIVSLLIFASLSTSSTISVEQNNSEAQNPLIKESLFISMERTPCFGRCPSFRVKIFNTGRVEYTGDSDVEKMGYHTSTLSKEQIKQLQAKITQIALFKMQDKYDANITDIPSCVLYVNFEGRKKKIFDRYGSPKELKEFEKMIDKFVLGSKLIKQNKQNGSKD
jgi:hypothetical protein